jgi:hypothetical protein
MMNFKNILIAGGAVLTLFLGLYFFMDQKIRIQQKQFNQEREVFVTAIENEVNRRLMAVKTIDSFTNNVKTKIVYLQKKDQILKQQQQLIKLKKDEINSYLNRTTESVLDSILRSN